MIVSSLDVLSSFLNFVLKVEHSQITIPKNGYNNY